MHSIPTREGIAVITGMCKHCPIGRRLSASQTVEWDDPTKFVRTIVGGAEVLDETTRDETTRVVPIERGRPDLTNWLMWVGWESGNIGPAGPDWLSEVFPTFFKQNYSFGFFVALLEDNCILLVIYFKDMFQGHTRIGIF